MGCLISASESGQHTVVRYFCAEAMSNAAILASRK